MNFAKINSWTNALPIIIFLKYSQYLRVKLGYKCYTIYHLQKLLTSFLVPAAGRSSLLAF